jgi:hypothetical protein
LEWKPIRQTFDPPPVVLDCWDEAIVAWGVFRMSRTQIALLFVGIVLLWLATPLVVQLWAHGLEERGLYGDQFGVVSSLFSGLALGGLIVTILQQGRDLRRQEAALSAATTAQLEASVALQRSYQATAYGIALDHLQDPRTIQARGHVYNVLAKKDLADWDETDRSHAEQVLRTFNSVGVMGEYELLAPDVIEDNWMHPLRTSWKTLEKYLDLLRKERKDPTVFRHYERYARRAMKLGG